MSTKKKGGTAKSKDSQTSCNVEAIVSIDDRGQMVLPKDLRKRAGISSGDKLAVTSWEMNGEVCCITLVKTDSLVNMVKTELGPVLKEIMK